MNVKTQRSRPAHGAGAESPPTSEANGMIRTHTDRLQFPSTAQQVQLESGPPGAAGHDEEHLMRTRQPTTAHRLGRPRRYPWQHLAALLLLACGLLGLAAPPAGAQVVVRLTGTTTPVVEEGDMLTITFTATPGNFRGQAFWGASLIPDDATLVTNVNYPHRGGRANYDPSDSRQRIAGRLFSTSTPDAVTYQVVITTAENTTPGPDRTFRFVLSARSLGGSSDPNARELTVTVLDDDAVRVGFTPPAMPDDVNEGRSIFFPLTFSGGAPTGNVTVNYILSGGGIEAGDFTGVTLTNGQIRGSQVFKTEEIEGNAPLTIAIEDDLNAELAEEFTVTLVSTTGPPRVNLTSGQTTARATIRASDPIMARIVGPPAVVLEGDPATFTVQMMGRTTQPTTFKYEVSAGSGGNPAEAPDFGSAFPTGDVEVRAGTDRSATFDVPTAEDGNTEGPETFTVTLSLSTNTGGGPGDPGTSPPPPGEGVTIVTDTAEGTIAASGGVTVAFTSSSSGPVSVTESDTASVPFPLTFGGDTPTSDVTVNYTLSGAGITASDFSGATSTPPPDRVIMGAPVTFTPEQIAGSPTLTVLINNDNANERNETFTVTLTQPSAAGGGVVSLGSEITAEATIRDDARDAITVRLDPRLTQPQETEGESFAFPLVFAGGIPTQDVVVRYDLSGAAGSGIEAGDFATEDAMGRQTALTTLTGLSATFELKAILDSRMPSADPLELPVPTYDDMTPEIAETFTVTLDMRGATSAGAVTVMPPTTPSSATIIDNEPTAVGFDPQKTATVRTGREGPDASISFPLRFLGLPPTADVFIGYAFGPGADPSVSFRDFDVLHGVDLDRRQAVRFPQPQNLALARPITLAAIAAGNAVLEIQIHDDNESEPEENFTVTLHRADLRGFVGSLDIAAGQTTARGAILDDDGISIDIVPVSPTTVVEGMPFEFNIVASLAVPADVSGTYSTTTGTAEAGHFTELSGVAFTIPMGATRATRATGEPFSVQTTDDMTIDGDKETFTVELTLTTAPADTTEGPAETVTIQENDLGLTLTGSTAAVEETSGGVTVTFTVTREGATSPAVTIPYEVRGDGIDKDDFNPAGDADNPLRGTVPLDADVLSGTFTLTITDDTDAEPAETLVVELARDPAQIGGLPAGGTVVTSTAASAMVTIAASDNTDVVLERVTGPDGSRTVVSGGGTVNEDGGTPNTGGTAIYRVSLAGDPSTEEVEVNWGVVLAATDPAAKVSAADFSGATQGTVTIPAGGTTSPEFSVTVTQNTGVNAAGKQFVMRAETTAAHTVVMSAELTTVIDDDDVSVAVSADQLVVTEGGTATFTFTRSGALGREVTVGYMVEGAGASGVDTDDFTGPEAGSITIAETAPSSDLKIAIEPDAVEDDNETLQVRITSVAFASGTGSGAVGGVGATAEITVIEGVRLSVEPEPPSMTSLPEGGVFRFRIVASRQATAAEPIRGTYSTVFGTGGGVANASDLTRVASGVEFAIPADAAQTGVFELQIADDMEVEADTETFTLELEATSPTNAVERAATITIQENDLRLTLSGPGGMVAEATPEQMATFTVTREGATSPAVTVPYEVSGVEARNFRHSGGGVGDGDNPLRGSVMLPAGEPSATFALTIIDDVAAEPAQTLLVALLTGDVTGLPQGGTVVPPTTGSTQATVTIAASDRVELVLERLDGPGSTFVTAGGTVPEDGTATYRVRLGPDSDPLSQALDVNWSVCFAGECVEGVDSPAQATDFSAPVTGTVSIAAGESESPTFEVSVTANDAVEGDRRFAVQASATTAGSVVVTAAPLTTEIVDDDASVAVSTTQAVVTEGDTATFTFTRSGALDRAVTVGYMVEGAGASGVDTDDFTDPEAGSITIAATAPSSDLKIAIEPDDGEDDDETLQVRITSVVFSGPGTGTVTPTGDPAQITVIEGFLITIAPVSTDPVVEGAAFEFNIVASRAVPAAVSGTYGTMTGTAGAGDITEISGVAFTIPAGETRATGGPFAVQTTDDSTIDDDRETFTVGLTLTNPPARTTADAAVTVTIQENDLRLTLSGPPEGQTEIDEASGGMATFTVARAGATRSEVTVEYEVSGVEAGDLDDSSGPPLRGTVTLGAGQASTSFALTVRDDAEAEGDETLEVRLVPESVTGVAGEVEFVAAADQPPRLTILEDDVGIRVSTPSGTAGEGSTAVFTVTREGDLRPEVALIYSVDGDGIDAADYDDLTDTEPLGTIILREEQASAEIRIRIVADGVSEPDETLRVTVAEARPPALNPGGKFELVTASAQVRIPRLEITVALSGPAEVPEGETAVFAVSLGFEPIDSVTTSEVRIAYTLGAPEVDTAQRGADYQSSSAGRGTLRIPAGSTEGVIEVPVLRDGLLEAVEDFRLTLNPENSEGGGGSIRFAEVRQLAVRILDNADQEARREQRTRAMLATTHRAAAQMATDVISNRFGHRNVRAQSPGDLEASNGTAWLGVGVANQGSPAASADSQAGARSEAEPQAPTVFADCVQGKSGRGRCAQRAVGERSHTAREERAVSLRLHAGERWRKHKRSRAESCSGRERTAKAFGRCAPAGSRGRADAPRRTESSSERERTAEASRPVRSAVEAEALRRTGTAPDARAPGSSLATEALSTALRLTGLPTGSAAGADAALSDPESAALLAGIDVPVRPFETDPYTVGSSGAPSTDASATDLGGLDPRLPSFAELLRGGHEFELSGEQAGLGGFGEGLSVWGAGTFQSLEGDPELDGQRLDYQGESFGIFLGADKRLALSGDGSELLAGAALGWTRGDLDYRDEALEVFELEGRFESKLWSIHPYASLRFSPRAQLWLIAGYGWGDVKIEERETREGERTATRRVETDATLWMVSAGAEGSVPLGSEASLLTARLQGTRTGGELDSARFGDGARLRGTRARTWRLAGELEVSHRFAFAEGGQFRPFATLRVRGDAGDDRQDDWEFAVDLGGGAELLWPERGLSLGLEGTAQLNQLQEYQEHRVTVDLSYDLAGDGRGLTVAVGSTLEGSGRLGDRVGRRSGLSAAGAFATDPYGPGGASFGALRPGGRGSGYTAGRELGALRHSLQGEIGYGLAVLPFWRPGLLTPYARFELAGRGASAYATGLRFEAAGGTRLGMEMGVDFDRRTGGAGTTAPDLQFLLTGELKF